MINYTIPETDIDLYGILELQKKNLPGALSQEEIKSQGFVTVSHSFEKLKILNETEPHVIAKENDKVIAYLLAMTVAARNDIPELISMFDIIETLCFNGT